jgi:hypothetical protein
MKATISIFLTFLNLQFAVAQGLEFSASINSGIFRYGGATATTATTTDISFRPIYVRNPYGRQPDLSYGFSLQLQQAKKAGWIWGAQVGYERLSSRVALSSILSESIFAWNTSASHLTLSNTFVNLYPYLSRRFTRDLFAFEFMFGTDVGLCVQSLAKLDLTLTDSRGSNYIVRANRDRIGIDFRPRVGVTAFYKNYGLSASYSFGLTNYSSTIDDPAARIFSRFLRIGVVYRWPFAT